MATIKEKLGQLVQELKRRKTFQAAAAYIVFSWVVIEGASVVLPAFAAPLWLLPAVIIALVLGLPVAVVISWIFDFSFGGFERTGPPVKSSHEQGLLADIASPDIVRPSIALPLGSARRRQVTLLRCSFELVKDGKSVVDHEALLPLRGRLDAVIDAAAKKFSGLCVERYGFSYEILFGFPTAFDNDALRACAAAISLEQELKTIRPKSKYANASLVPSIGVHSDTVIIERADNEQAAIRVIGNISQVAAWLQSILPGGSIAYSAQTHELLRGKVVARSLGKKTNVHASADTEVFLAESLRSQDQVTSPLDNVGPEMIGRDAEIALLLDRWQLAKEGEAQFVVLRGEAGIGKSTLVSTLVNRIANENETQVISLYCSPFESDNPFHPVLEYFFGPVIELEDKGIPATHLNHLAARLEESGLNPADADSLRAALLATASTDENSLSAGKSAAQSRRELQRCLVSYFAALARQGNLLIVFEDIQWVDPSTLEVIEMVVQRSSVDARLLCLFTGRERTEFDWMARSEILVLDLMRLPRRVTEALVKRTAGNIELPSSLLARITAESDGNPFFAEQLTRAISENSDQDTTSLTLPGTVQQSLLSRIDKLGNAQLLLQLCSLLGKRFDYKLLLAVSETKNEKSLQEDLRKIVNAGLLLQEGAVPDSSYRFRHVLMQEAAHELLLESTRVEQHARIARIIESEFPEKVQRRPALLAYHHAEGDEPLQAVLYRIKACRKSLRVYAIHEAIEQADKGLAVLKSIPASEDRDALEVTLQSQRAKALLAVRGYGDPSVEKVYARALALSEKLGDTPQLFPLVVGLWLYFFISGKAERALALAQRLVGIAEEKNSPAKNLQARHCLGHTLFRLGRLDESRQQLEKAIENETFEDDFSSESASGDDTRIHARVVLAHVYWHLGDKTRSAEFADQSIQLAEELGNPFGIIFASFMSSWLCMVRKQPEECASHAARVSHVARERRFDFWLPLADFMQAWASCDGGDSGDDRALKSRIESMEESLAAFSREGGTNGETCFALQVAEDHLALNQTDDAAKWLKRAEDCSAVTGEAYMKPDMSRIAALLAASRGDTLTAEKLYADALTRARAMGSISLAERINESMKILQLAESRNDRKIIEATCAQESRASEG